MRRKRQKIFGCQPARLTGRRSLAAIVRAYRTYNQHTALDEIAFFEGMLSIDSTIHNAGLAIDERGKRFDHQRRIGASALRAGKTGLRKRREAIQSAQSFHELHKILIAMCRPILGLGELYAYDTALRLGAHLGLRPERVYLHAGTRDGAHALGIDTSRQYVEVDELPKPLRAMHPHELEDILCIYKDEIRR